MTSTRFFANSIFLSEKNTLTGAPDIVVNVSEEESEGNQIFICAITSIPAAYNVQWLVSENNSDVFTTLDENAEEYRGTSHTLPQPVLVVRQKEQLKNNIYQIEVQNFIGGRKKKIPSMKNACFLIVLNY